jgi:hypothetical protein
MVDFFYNNIEHILCCLILISRLGDILSTYLVSPTLKLEANPIVRKLGWPFALLSVFVCLIAYLDIAAGFIILVPSLMVSAANISKFWITKSIGETQYARFVLRVASKAKLSHVIFSMTMASFFIILTGLIPLFLSRGPEDMVFWFAFGIILYGIIILLYGCIHYFKLIKKARNMPAEDLL